MIGRLIRRIWFRRWVRCLPQSTPTEDARIVAAINRRLAVLP